jgi:putative transposase
MIQGELKVYGMRSSMSRKDDCWDVTATESLWSSLNLAKIHGQNFSTSREVKDEVIDWINFYNTKRLHSILGFISPIEV